MLEITIYDADGNVVHSETTVARTASVEEINEMVAMIERGTPARLAALIVVPQVGLVGDTRQQRGARKMRNWLRRLFCTHPRWEFIGYGSPGFHWHRCERCFRQVEFAAFNPPINIER